MEELKREIINSIIGINNIYILKLIQDTIRNLQK